jgi:hypothetical protein
LSEERNLKPILAIVALILALCFSPDAHAYLDPGSGSYMLQILLGTLVAGFFAVKQYWHRLKYFLVERFRKREDQDHE